MRLLKIALLQPEVFDYACIGLNTLAPEFDPHVMALVRTRDANQRVQRRTV